MHGTLLTFKAPLQSRTYIDLDSRICPRSSEVVDVSPDVSRDRSIDRELDRWASILNAQRPQSTFILHRRSGPVRSTDMATHAGVRPAAAPDLALAMALDSMTILCDHVLRAGRHPSQRSPTVRVAHHHALCETHIPQRHLLRCVSPRNVEGERALLRRCRPAL